MLIYDFSFDWYGVELEQREIEFCSQICSGLVGLLGYCLLFSTGCIHFVFMCYDTDTLHVPDGRSMVMPTEMYASVKSAGALTREACGGGGGGGGGVGGLQHNKVRAGDTGSEP
jgi:hypothetical protein